MYKPTHLSLFSGIGGLDIAAEMAGFRTVGQCERADYPTKILEKHWPNVARWRDIRSLTKEAFHERTRLQTTVDVISGGFPCQPFSVAGKQKGKEDDRYLWPEMFRVIRELKPRWVVGENVPGILRIAAADIVQDLEREGYDTVIFDFEAAAIGAPHRRERVAFVANRRGERLERRNGEEQQKCPSECSFRASGTCGERHNGRWESESKLGGMADGLSDWLDRGMSAPGKWMPDPHPSIPRTANKIAHRADRIKCLGNAVVPQQFYPIFYAIRQELWGEALGLWEYEED